MKPNWNDIKRCPIWKTLGVIACNDCDTQDKCWVEDEDDKLVLQDMDRAAEAINRIIRAKAVK